MGTTERDRPAVELLKSIPWTVQLLLFGVLALTPAVAGFLVPVGPPQYVATVGDVSPAGAAPADAVAFGDLSAESQAAFEATIATEGDELARETASPPSLLAPGETVVVRGEYAFAVEVTRNRPPLRPVAVLGGLIGSTVTTLLGAALLGRSPL